MLSSGSGRRPAHVLTSLALLALAACADTTAPARVLAPPSAASTDRAPADVTAQRAALRQTLAHYGFTGRIASTLEARLGRPVDKRLADLGRMLWFDKIG